MAFSMFEMKPQQNSYRAQGVPIALKRRPNSNSSGRKRMPSNDVIYCWYIDGNIFFDLSESLGQCDIEIVDDQSNLIVENTFDMVDKMTIYVGLMTNISISVTTEVGIIYSGVM